MEWVVIGVLCLLRGCVAEGTVGWVIRFECGNLQCAIQTGEFDYDLILRPDFRTTGHTQWYYFRLNNVRANKKYRFMIVNYTKADSLYNEGLKPLVYSEAKAAKDGCGWYRAGVQLLLYLACHCPLCLTAY